MKLGRLRLTTLHWVRVSSLIIFAIASTGLVGHIYSKPLMYTWDKATMAPNTAICLIFTAVNLFLISLWEERK